MGCNYYPPPRDKADKIMEFIGGIVFISVIVGCIIMVILEVFK